MSTAETLTATSIVDVNTDNRTYIGCSESEWEEEVAYEHWAADYLPQLKRDYYQHLNEINDGKKNGSWTNERYFTDDANRDLIEVLTQQLELTAKQKVRAKNYFLAQDLDDWGIRKEIVAWAICAYLVHSDEQDTRKCHPQTPCENTDELFAEVAESLDLTEREQEKTYGKVQADFMRR